MTLKEEIVGFRSDRDRKEGSLDSDRPTIVKKRSLDSDPPMIVKEGSLDSDSPTIIKKDRWILIGRLSCKRNRDSDRLTV